MCHLILLMPVLALPVLWLLPLGEGVAAYATVLVVSIAVYWITVNAMRAPLQIGTETPLRAVRRARTTVAPGGPPSLMHS